MLSQINCNNKDVLKNGKHSKQIWKLKSFRYFHSKLQRIKN